MTGNLHFESVMLFFLLWSFYKLHQQKWIFAAILFACSISVKLIPLLFLPLFYQWFIKKPFDRIQDKKSPSSQAPSKRQGILKLLGFYLIILTTTILLFLPLYASGFIENYSNSVGLWFKHFEFNASFYYLFREIGYLFRDWNEIAVIGKITPILTVLFLVAMTFFRKNKTFTQLITAMLFCLCFYYFTATTVHPWYLATPLILSIFTKYRFPFVWSFVIILSYQAYSNFPWKENLWFVGLEYFILFSVLIFEFRKNSQYYQKVK